jgi:hypothetical protein
MYGISLDKLFESMKSRSASGQANPRSVVRCRRWLRSMYCESDEDYDLIIRNLDDLHDRYNLIKDVMNENRIIHTAIHEYEEARLTTHRKIQQDLSSFISQDLQTLQHIADRLLEMKTYCLLRSQADHEYSAKLKSISQVRSPNTNSLNAEEESFLDRIDLANQAFSEQYGRLAILLSSVMMEDIDSLVMQSNQVFQSYENHLAQEYALFDSQQDIINKSITKLNRCFHSNQLLSHEKLQILDNEIKSFHLESSDDDPSASIANGQSSAELLLDGYLTCLSFSLVVASAVFGVKKTIISVEDFFLSVYEYRKAIYDSTALLTTLQQIAQSIKVLSMKLLNQCQSVITVIAKYLAGEQSKIFIAFGESLLAAIEPHGQPTSSSGRFDH